MPVKSLLTVDPKKPPWEQSPPLHNRWHPAIPPVATVEEGEIVRVEMVDWTGGQIKNSDSADDVKNVDLTQVHYLSGPLKIPTAEPGDLLKVEFLQLLHFHSLKTVSDTGVVAVVGEAEFRPGDLC